MIRGSFRPKLALVCAAASIVVLQACGGGGGAPAIGPGPGGGPGGGLSLTRQTISVTTTLPTGVAGSLTSMTAETSIGASPIAAGGASQVQIFNEGPQLTTVYDAARNTILMGWIGGGKTVLSARTTAEVLLYFDMHGYLLPGAARMKVVGDLATRTEVQPVADAISTALAADPKALSSANAAILSARRTAVNQIRASGRSRGVEVNPSAARSGITIDQQGMNSVIIHNDFRRRAVAFLDRVESVSAEGAAPVPNPANIAEVDISPAAGVTSVLESLADAADGNVGYKGFDSAAVPLPLFPETSFTTKYKLTVVGLGASAGASEGLTPNQTAKMRSVTAKSMLVDFAIPLFANTVLPLKGATIDDYLNLAEGSDVVGNFVSAFSSAAPGVWDKAYQGNITGGITDLTNAVVTNAPARALFLSMVYRLTSQYMTFETEEAFTKAAETHLKAMDVAGSMVQGLDSLMQVKQIKASNRAEVWDLTSNPSRVYLNPASSDIGPLESQTYRAVVPGTLPTGTHLYYKWTTSNHYGGLREPGRKDGAYPAMEDAGYRVIEYAPSGQEFGEDTVTVEAFEFVNNDIRTRKSIGTATVKVRVREFTPEIVPKRISLRNGETHTFTAKVKFPAAPDEELSYRWTSSRQFGHLSGVTENQVTSIPSANYTSTEPGEGSDDISVEVYSRRNGSTISLGVARAKVLTEFRHTIILGRYETKVYPLPDDRMRVEATVIWPKIDGALAYKVYCYDFYDPLVYGERVLFGWFGPHPTQVSKALPPLVAGEYLHGIAGGTGPAGPNPTAGYDARFKGMIVEVEVIY